MRNLQRIVFFWVGENTEIPEAFVSSIRRAFGDEMDVVQLSDKATPRVVGVTTCKNMKLSPRIMVARLEAYASLAVKEPTLYLDADMLVTQDFDLPSLAPNEVGVTRRDESDGGLINWRFPVEFPEFEGKTFPEVMPYIYSFVYVCSEILFVRQLNALRKLPKKYQLWYGDQVTLKSELDAGRFVIRDFSVRNYNRTVRSAIEFKEIAEGSREVCIAHFKGVESKVEMREANAYLEGVRPSKTVPLQAFSNTAVMNPSIFAPSPDMKQIFGDATNLSSGFLACGMFTKSYAIKAERLAQSLQALGISYALYEVPAVHSSISPKGENNSVYTKANFISHLLNRFPCPILYLDVDCVVLKPLDIVTNLVNSQHDFAIFNWLAVDRNDAYIPCRVALLGDESDRYYRYYHQIRERSNDQLICSGAVQFWRYTDAARSLLSSWFEIISTHPHAADDVSLGFAFNNRISPLHKLLRPYWLPKNYARCAWWIFDEPIINHPEIPFTEDWPSLHDAKGRRHAYLDVLSREDEKYYFQPGTFLDTYTGDILDPIGIMLGKIQNKFWI
jgi:hypothetical protein